MANKYKSPPPPESVVKTLLPVPHPETGQPWYDYDYKGVGNADFDENDPSTHGGTITTGPISGTIILKDGTAYDLTPEVIPHWPGHKGRIIHHIESLHEAAGHHFDFEKDEYGNTKLDDEGNSIPIPYVHVCHDGAGDGDPETDQNCACGNKTCVFDCEDEGDE